MMTKFLVAGLAAVAVGGTASAALVLTASSSAGDHIYMRSPDSGTPFSAWNTVPAGASANIYWDANTNGVFGEAGENSGNGATLAFNAAITSGQALHFAVEGFANATTDGFIEVTVQLTDLSTTRLVVHEGTTLAFNDSNGDMWEADFEFNNGAYGDVVSNISHTPGGAAADHQGVLTFSQVPEPGSLALLGLGGLALLQRRRA